MNELKSKLIGDQLNSMQSRFFSYGEGFNVKQLTDGFGTEFVISPDYHAAVTWGPDQQSCFIESLLIGAPIPHVLWAYDEDCNTVILDGVQRVTALVEYVNDRLPLSGLTVVELLSGKVFSDLPPVWQHKLMYKYISGFFLGSDADNESTADIIFRLNYNG